MTQHGTAAALGQLDANTLEEIARVICGDDNLYYRKGWEISRFFINAGWEGVPAFDAEFRRDWAKERLTERRTQPAALEQVLLRLADPREYLDEPNQLPQVVSALNAFLVHEGLRLDTTGGRPRLQLCDPALAQPGQHAPAEFRATLTDIIRDPVMARVLQHRLDEAQTCYHNGAHIAATIMLGSLLEGVLLQVIKEHDTTLLGSTPPDKATLEKLINACNTARLIGADIERFCHELRIYRNYVHPAAEIREAHAPDRDTLNVCWQVVGAVLNDLKSSHPAPPAPA
ncbi:hypothetical protein [Actinacidiphila sp. bgisy160]|uniref:hypothetical protein n=1 Tax=Actinacidiphila sp. bgisy160 TaxID=3413796 RepID=UPI003D74127D